MKLWDVLSAGAYDQLVDIFVSNAYDENVRIGQGSFEEMRMDEDVFDNLMLEVQMIYIMNDKVLVIICKSEKYDTPLKELYNAKYAANWKRDDPSSRPYLMLCELEQMHGNRFHPVNE